jgi:hypothetical protein
MRLVILVLVSLLVAMPIASGQSDTSLNDKLNQLNLAFRENCATAKQEIRRQLGPVIFMSGDQMTLLYKGERTMEQFVPNEFTYLKSVDHVPLMCYLTLINKSDRPLTMDEMKQLAMLAESITPIQAKLMGTTSGDTPETERHLRMVRASLDFLNSVHTNKTVSREQLRKFARSVSADAAVNIHGAIAAQLSRMQEITDKWRAHRYHLLTGAESMSFWTLGTCPATECRHSSSSATTSMKNPRATRSS